jgi:hypothetical protein
LKKYLNLSGNSGVTHYSIGKEYIKVWFVHAARPYIYDYVRPGRKHVELMKILAAAGKGLSTYISQQVKGNYSE